MHWSYEPYSPQPPAFWPPPSNRLLVLAADKPCQPKIGMPLKPEISAKRIGRLINVTCPWLRDGDGRSYIAARSSPTLPQVYRLSGRPRHHRNRQRLAGIWLRRRPRVLVASTIPAGQRAVAGRGLAGNRRPGHRHQQAGHRRWPSCYRVPSISPWALIALLLVPPRGIAIGKRG